MNRLSEQSVLEMAAKAFAECSTPAEMRYVARVMTDFASDDKSRTSLDHLLKNHLFKVPSA